VLERSQAVILGIRSPPTATYLAISNNPYQALSEDDDEEAEQDLEETKELPENQEMTTEEDPPSTGEEKDTESLSMDGSSPERRLLSRKALQTLRKIKSLKNALMDNSVRTEIEEVLGKDSIDPILSTNSDNSSTDDDCTGKASAVQASTSATGNETGNDTSQEDVEMENVENETQSSAHTTPERASSANSKAPNQAATPQDQSGDGGTQASSSTSRDGSGKNVSFAAAVSNQNSHTLRTGNLQAPSRRNPPVNPYSKPDSFQNNSDEGIIHAQRRPPTSARLDKAITLRKNNSRQHIHRYTLRIKTI
jgi:hypothetical protein